MKNLKKWSKAFLLCMLAVFLWLPSLTGYAQEEVTDLSKLMVARTAINALAEPQEESAVVFSYEANAAVLVTGETAAGWYRVVYQDQTGYVKKADLKENDINIAELNEEFENNEMEGKLYVEEVERIRAQITRSRIWGSIIIVLIIGIFGTGIYSTIRAERKKRQSEPIAAEMEKERSINAEFEEADRISLDIIDLDDSESGKEMDF